MSKVRRIKRILTARQLPHYYGAVRKLRRMTQIANKRKHKQRNDSKR